MKILIALSLLLVLFPLDSHSQDKKAQQDALRRMQAANQRLSSEKAQLEREKAQLAKEKAQAEAAREGVQRNLKSERGTAAKQKQEIEALEEAKRGLEAKLAEAAVREEALKQQLAATEKEMAQAKAQAQAQGEQLTKRVANQQQTIGFWQGETDTCRSRNAELGKLGGELLARYRAKTCQDVMSENEPFTGIGRARMENLLEGYRDKLIEQKFEVKR